jgi:hypothetical protein
MSTDPDPVPYSGDSINEPGKSRQSLTPPSVNEPPEAPAVDAPAPVITALAPDSCVIGKADFTLVVSGENFFAGSVIFFAGHDEPTTFNETDRTLQTIVKPSLWDVPVVVQCQVHNGEVMSNAVDFSFTADGGSAGASHEAAAPEHDDGDDIQPTHRGKPSQTLPHKRKK